MSTRYTINNKPDANKLWAGIGGYFDSLGEILCEFIDNSISNFNKHNQMLRHIIIRFREDDSGTGILNLGAAFTLGSNEGAETLLNEHGFGFKHALASANPNNDTWKILTCTKGDSEANRYKVIEAPYVIGDITVNEVSGSWVGKIGCATGTIFSFDCSEEIGITFSRPNL